MIYGTKIIYKHNEEVPVVNELGETQFDKDGDFLTKTQEINLELVFTAQTYIIYKNYIGRDLMSDFYNTGRDSQQEYEKSYSTIQKVKGNTKKLSNEDIKVLCELNFNNMREFFQNLTVAMIATNEYPKIRSYQQICAELPDGLLDDKEFIEELWAILQFSIKKKVKQMVAK